MPISDCVDQKGIADRVASTKLLDGLIGIRRVPTACVLSVRELNDDQVAIPISFKKFSGSAMDQKATTERQERFINPTDILASRAREDDG